MRLVLFILLWCWAPLAGLAQTEVTPPANGAKLVVATRILPPFVFEDEGVLTGFSVDLWTELSKRVGIAFEWKVKTNVAEILDAVETGEAQTGIAAISITAAREQKFDFSQPMFESGLQVMVPLQDSAGFSPTQILSYMTRGAMPYLLGVLALLILIPGHVVWFAERKHSDSEFSKTYFPGIFQAMAWALSAAAGQQNGSPRSRLGRFMSVGAIFVSLLFLTYWQAELTSSFTVQQLSGDISGPDDLPGRRVGTTEKSTSEAYLKGKNATVVSFARIQDAFSALEVGKLDAVVFDSPVLMYHAANTGRGKVRVVGPVFKRENYGIVFPRTADRPRQLSIRKQINEALLTMREDGSFDTLYNKWFQPE